MHVAICIVGFRNGSDIERCVAALANSEHQDFQVLICENGGESAFQALRDRLPAQLPGGQPVRLVAANDNPGYAAGVNICIAHAARADAWWVLNPDTVPSPSALRLMCEHLSAGGFGAVGCTVHYSDGVVESRGGRWRPWLARATSLERGKRIGEPLDQGALESSINYLNGASMLVADSFLRRVGPMREDYFLYAEEVEWCLRGIARGERLGMASKANVLHFKGSTTGSIRDVANRLRTPVYLDERNKLLLTRDLFPWRQLVVVPATLVLLCLRFGRRRAWRQLGYALAGWWAGLRGERGKPIWIGGVRQTLTPPTDSAIARL